MSRWERVTAGTAATLALAAALTACSSTIDAADIGAVDQATAQKGLVTSQDMPDGWRSSPADTGDDDTTKYAPSACKVFGEPPPATSRMATTSYERGGMAAAALVQTIYRPDAQTPAQAVAALRALQPTCASYRSREGDTKGYAISVQVVVVTKQATDTFAVRSSVSGAMMGVSDEIIWVAAGDVVVRYDSITAGDGLAQEDFEDLVHESLSRLEK